VHLLFIASNLGKTVGGIETLIARMSKWLLAEGHSLTLLTTSAQEFRDIFPQEMRIIELGDHLHKFCFYHVARREWPDLRIARPDVIKSFHLRDAWISSILSPLIEPMPKVIFGNYFPYVFPQSRIPFKDLENKPFLSNLSRFFRDESILCIDREQIAQFRRQYGIHRKPVFWPLPIDNPNKTDLPRRPKWGHIVSVGRLEPMKEYNIYMIDIIHKLRKAGLSVTWTVYGEGSLTGPMNRKINELGLNEVIRLKGRLKYTDFAAVMQDAYLFVGGGTAIIEAAYCGVPGIMTLAFDTSGYTYGPLFKYPFGNLGLRTTRLPDTSVEREIERIINLSKHEYLNESEACQGYAQKYSLDISMQKFMGILENASAPRTSKRQYCYHYWNSFIRAIAENSKEVFQIIRGNEDSAHN
jgi:hypothetical protein